MQAAQFEHVNITVHDCRKTAKRYCDLFGWKVRWEGEAMDGAGYTVHVGTKDRYLALYTPGDPLAENAPRYTVHAALNHIGIVVDDLNEMESRLNALGIKATAHHDYEPGKRFYFMDEDGIEIEVVSYQ